MDAASIAFLVQQLGYQIPVMLVYLVGLGLAVAFLRRYPTAALLTLLGTGLLLVMSIGLTILQAYLFQRRADDGWSVQQYAQIMSLIGIFGSIGRAIGLALLVSAVFVGRSRPTSPPGQSWP